MTEARYEPVTSSRLYESVVRQILDLAAGGELKPGSRLPPERELSERIGVGRNVLREAFRVLEASGIVHSRQGGGRYLRDENIQPALQTDGVILRLEKSVIADILESREILEAQIARLAANRATPQQAENLIAMCAGSARTWQDNVRFHTTVAALTGNFMLERLVRLQMDLLSDVHQRKHYRTPQDASGPFAEHTAIAQAIAAHDAPAAEEAVHQHFTHTRSMITPTTASPAQTPSGGE